MDAELKGFAGGFAAYHATHVGASLEGELPYFEGCNCAEMADGTQPGGTGCGLRSADTDAFAFMPRLCRRPELAGTEQCRNFTRFCTAGSCTGGPENCAAHWHDRDACVAARCTGGAWWR